MANSSTRNMDANSGTPQWIEECRGVLVPFKSGHTINQTIASLLNMNDGQQMVMFSVTAEFYRQYALLGGFIGQPGEELSKCD